jgi:hypothetical protein
MFKPLLFGMLLTFTATPAMAQVTASEFAERLAPLIGEPLGDTNIKLFGARAEGAVAILTLDSPDWEGERANASDIFVRTFCEVGENVAFFSRMQVRIDTLEKGQGLIAGEVVSKCPPPETD